MWIGTSGWTYDGWRGPFYRSGSRGRYSGPAEEARPAQVVYASYGIVDPRDPADVVEASRESSTGPPPLSLPLGIRSW